ENSSVSFMNLKLPPFQYPASSIQQPEIGLFAARRTSFSQRQSAKRRVLQWVLTHSRSAKLLAVHRVTTNRGAKTPGVDNVRWRTNRQKLQAAYHLKRHGYRPWPLRRLYIPKPNGKLRPLSIPTLHDRAMQALYALALAPIVESLADPNSYGFREGRCCADALEQCFNVLARKTSAPVVLEGDIRACFDELSPAWLLAHVPLDKRLLRAWLQAGYWERNQLARRKDRR
ncbi:MAG TPA: reverse transcriptase N-terminal domain-containing protein, partial [Blastocatellia bacterium]|nr:reverse transcriptase N-terminal domain-containing protein [Blastocatellia bacterium]